jgi:hypothetical protein
VSRTHAGDQHAKRTISMVRAPTSIDTGLFVASLSAAPLNSDANAVLPRGGEQNNYSNDDNLFDAI